MPKRIGRPPKSTPFIHADDGSVIAVASNGRQFFVDDTDADLLRFAWKCQRNRYVTRTIYANGEYKHETMHRVIMERVAGRPLLNSECIDHIDGDGFNNRRSNLRIASQSQNMANSRLSKANRSGFKGVYRYGHKWRACLSGKNLGSFLTPEEAHAAYCAAALEKYGEFANFGDNQHG